MILQIFEICVFQFLFFVVYDLLLKSETFFQWNRFYLLSTFIISLVLPWIELDFFSKGILNEAEYLIWELQEIVLTKELGLSSPGSAIPYKVLFILGVFVMTVVFVYKLHRIRALWKTSKISHHPGYTKVVMQNSMASFSFFKLLFIGDAISKEKEPQILSHELVHIKQWHSLDLLFFEAMRIVFWFNPMTYLFQNRVAEVHEYIADSLTSTGKAREQYELLLSQVFQTKNISFTNQFFKESLIKKRIVMLKKEKSSQIRLFRYSLPLSLLVMMIAYTSCEPEAKKANELQSTRLSAEEDLKLIPFMEVQEAPIFPGCEDAEDARSCFIAEIQNHVKQNFSYPKEAQDLGIEGRVSVMFSIDKNGEVTNIRQRGPHELLEKEVVRIIKKLPKMQPGRHQGEVVNVPFSLPVVFKLH